MLLLGIVSRGIRSIDTGDYCLVDIPYSIEEASAHILVLEIDSPIAVRVFRVVVVQALAILGALLGGVLQPKDLPKGAGDGGALKPDFAVVHAVDIANQHIDSTVIPAIRHGQHVVKGPGPGKKRHDAPESTTTEMCAAHALEFIRTGDLDH